MRRKWVGVGRRMDGWMDARGVGGGVERMD